MSFLDPVIHFSFLILDLYFVSVRENMPYTRFSCYLIPSDVLGWVHTLHKTYNFLIISEFCLGASSLL